MSTGAPVQNTCGQPRVFNTQAKARDTPIALVAGRCLLALLASGLGSSVGAPSTTDPLIHSTDPQKLAAQPHAVQPRLSSEARGLLAPQAYKILGCVRKARGGAFAVLNCELARFAKCSEQLREAATYFAKSTPFTKKMELISLYIGTSSPLHPPPSSLPFPSRRCA
jgi:hypothetical protein